MLFYKDALITYKKDVTKETEEGNDEKALLVPRLIDKKGYPIISPILLDESMGIMNTMLCKQHMVKKVGRCY